MVNTTYAYRLGHVAGINNLANTNPYDAGTRQHSDYEHGYDMGLHETTPEVT